MDEIWVIPICTYFNTCSKIKMRFRNWGCNFCYYRYLSYCTRIRDTKRSYCELIIFIEEASCIFKIVKVIIVRWKKVEVFIYVLPVRRNMIIRCPFNWFICCWKTYIVSCWSSWWWWRGTYWRRGRWRWTYRRWLTGVHWGGRRKWFT